MARARNSAPSLRSGNASVGYAVFFEFYSSFQGRAGLFLDDPFVRPAFRKHGIGKALLAHVAGIAWKEDYFCMRWEVLDWNTQAIEFYRNMGAVFLDEWKSAFLIGDAPRSGVCGGQRVASPSFHRIVPELLVFHQSPAIFSPLKRLHQ